MSSLPRTTIEYGTHAWNFLRGCSNGPDICKTRDKCWAKAMAGRFRKGKFSPTFDPVAFNATFPRKPSRILVCFTGDISYATYAQRWSALRRIADAPEHVFLLLTKRPFKGYDEMIEWWPRNAILMATLTGAETPRRQQQVMDELRAVKGEHRLGLSYEPTLGPLAVKLDGMSWVVYGPQGGKGAAGYDIRWYNAVLEDARRVGARVWAKNALRKHAGPAGLIQEFPQEAANARLGDRVSGAYAQRDAMLEALDAMPVVPHHWVSGRPCPSGTDCPACAVLADRKAFRKAVMGE